MGWAPFQATELQCGEPALETTLPQRSRCHGSAAITRQASLDEQIIHVLLITAASNGHDANKHPNHNFWKAPYSHSSFRALPPLKFLKLAACSVSLSLTLLFSLQCKVMEMCCWMFLPNVSAYRFVRCLAGEALRKDLRAAQKVAFRRRGV